MHICQLNILNLRLIISHLPVKLVHLLELHFKFLHSLTHSCIFALQELAVAS